MAYLLETERLGAREFVLEDAPFIVRLLNSPGWLQFIGDRKVKTEEEAKTYLENGPLKSYREYGFGLYLIERKVDKTAIGMCGILKRERLDDPDIGFAYLPEFHGKGYALEMAQAMLQYARERLLITGVSAIVLPSNAPSIRILEKLGLRPIKSIYFPGNNEELLLYHSQS